MPFLERLKSKQGGIKGMLLAYYEYLVTVTQKGFSDLPELSLPLVEALTLVRS